MELPLAIPARRQVHDVSLHRRASRFEAARERLRLASPPSSDGGLPRLRKDLDIQTALETLAPPLRETLVLAVCQGLPYQEVAEVLGIPVGTVKSRVFNALSVVANDEALNNALGGPVPAAVIMIAASAVVLGGYSLWNWKHLNG